MARARITPVFNNIPEEYQGPRVGNTGKIGPHNPSSGPHSPNFRYTEDLGMHGSKFGAPVTLAGSENYYQPAPGRNDGQFKGQTSQLTLPMALDSKDISPDAGPRPMSFHDSRLMNQQQPFQGQGHAASFINQGNTSLNGNNTINQNDVYLHGANKRRLSEMASTPLAGQQNDTFFDTSQNNISVDPFTNGVSKTHAAFHQPRARESLRPQNVTITKRHEIFNSTEMNQQIPVYPYQPQQYPVAQIRPQHELSSIRSADDRSPQLGLPKSRVLGSNGQQPAYQYQHQLDVTNGSSAYNPLAQIVSIVQPVKGTDFNQTMGSTTLGTWSSYQRPNDPWIVNQVTPMEIIDEPKYQNRPSLEYNLPSQDTYIQQYQNFEPQARAVGGQQPLQGQPTSLSRTVADVPYVDLTVDALKPGQAVSAAGGSFSSSNQGLAANGNSSSQNNMIAKQILSEMMRNDDRGYQRNFVPVQLGNTEYLRSEDEPMPIVIDINDDGNQERSKVVPQTVETRPASSPRYTVGAIQNSPSRSVSPSRANSMKKVNPRVYNNFFSGSEQQLLMSNSPKAPSINNPPASVIQNKSPLMVPFGVYNPISPRISQQRELQKPAGPNTDPFYRSPGGIQQQSQGKSQFLAVPNANSNQQPISDPNSRLPNPNTGGQVFRN